MTTPARTGRLIVIDDEVELMTALCESLREEGFDAVGYSDPAAGLAVLEHLRSQAKLAAARAANTLLARLGDDAPSDRHQWQLRDVARCLLRSAADPTYLDSRDFWLPKNLPAATRRARPRLTHRWPADAARATVERYLGRRP